MNTIDINKILERDMIEKKIKNILIDFNENKNNILIKRGIYIYGNSGIGKTRLVTKILNDLNYDIIKYDAGDVRNKIVIDNITNKTMSDCNIMSLFKKEKKNIAIIMDEIDGMNNGDKGGINSLIKLIRPKKTKKQKSEDITMNPIICIGNYHIDKKIKELMKICHVFELKNPTNNQIKVIVDNVFTKIQNESIKNSLINIIHYDLRKLDILYKIYCKSESELIEKVSILLNNKLNNEDSKEICQTLLKKSHSINEHNIIMNETERTIVGLLIHENIIDYISKINKKDSINFYIKILNNICFADYIDRITFQKQIWLFNEMSSLLKTFQTLHYYHKDVANKINKNISEIRFTKVLTKYSTEFNNFTFIQNLCHILLMDKKDLLCYFLQLKSNYTEDEIIQMLSNYEISKLDINRMYRYLNNYLDSENSLDEMDDIDMINI